MNRTDAQSQRHPLTSFTSPETVARGLGWLSLAIGAAEMLAPGALNRRLGKPSQEGLIRGFGVREAIAGMGILLQKDPELWVWGRVAGDVLDLAGIATALVGNNPKRGNALLALGGVAAIALVDVCCAQALTERRRARTRTQQPRQLAHDYSNRRGMPRPPSEMRGAARALAA